MFYLQDIIILCLILEAQNVFICLETPFLMLPQYMIGIMISITGTTGIRW